MKKPNVLLLVVDSLRQDAVFKPNRVDDELQTLSRLAEKGVTFRNCISQGISTAPAMTAMLTGRYPLDYGGHWYLEDGQPTFAQQFQQAGYDTGAVHSNPYVSSRRNFDRGFDWFEEDIVAFEPDRILENGPEKIRRLASRLHRIVSKTPYMPAPETNERVLSFVDQATEPWFCWAQYMDVHGPYLGGERTYRKKFSAEFLWRKAAVRSPEEITDSEHEQLWRDYCGEISYLDRYLGELLEALRERDELEETLVVVTADHGDEFCEHGAYGHGNLPYAELTTVPLVMRFPEMLDIQPTEVDDLVRSVDILPTVLEISDIQMDEAMSKRCEGQSLLPALDGDSVSAEYALTEKRVRDEQALRIGFRDEEWSFIYDGKDDAFYLYDLQSDPGESESVLNVSLHIRERFEELLKDRLTQIDSTCENVSVPDVATDAGVGERLRALGYRE